MQSTIETINSWLSDIGQDIGQAISLDENGLVTLGYSGGIDCTIEFDRTNEWLYLHTPLAAVQGRNRAEFFATVLEKNLFCFHTDGGALGLDKRNDRILFCRRFNPLSFDSEGFIKALEKFMQTAAELKAQLNQSATAEETPAKTDDALINPSAAMMNQGFLKA